MLGLNGKKIIKRILTECIVETVIMALKMSKLCLGRPLGLSGRWAVCIDPALHLRIRLQMVFLVSIQLVLVLEPLKYNIVGVIYFDMIIANHISPIKEVI